MEERSLYFWQNIPSHIQAPALRILAERWHGPVTGVWCESITQDRRRLGWQDPDLGRLKQLTLDFHDRNKSAAGVMESVEQNSIHIFSGLHAYRPVITAFKAAVARRITDLGLMVEPGISLGWKGRIRPLRARLLTRFHYLRHIKLVLAMGINGVEFYTKAGFPSDRTLAFMYQAESAARLADATVNDPVRLIYVGKFVHRKGLDVLLEALSLCHSQNWRLTVVGNDDNASAMRQLAKTLRIDGTIQWLGAQPSAEISDLLSQHDLCIVPSRFEGWGVVTNEAIQAGLGVICSSAVTSSEIVRASGAGAVFTCGDPQSLADKIGVYLSDPHAVANAKVAARQFLHKISPEALGQYLLDAISYAFLDGVKPSPPWHR